MKVPLRPGETASVRCIVATRRDSLTAEQRRHFAPVSPFRNMKNKAETTLDLPEGVYRVRAAYDIARDDEFVETNVIEVRIGDRREQSNAPGRNERSE